MVFTKASDTEEDTMSATKTMQPVTIRYANAGDEAALTELALLDSSKAPSGVVLVAEVGGQLWAARSLSDQQAVADPFRPSGELSVLLSERARQLRSAERERRQRLPALRFARAA
jgi:hypothetical protein